MDSPEEGSEIYAAEVEGLDRFGQMLTELVSEILQQQHIAVHAVTFRVKTEESAKQKLERKPDRYDSASALTDLLGLRVICYFSDQVDQVAAALESQFSIDQKNSEDKRQRLGDREFGYLSLHRIATVPPARGGLIEYKRFKDVAFEIQIRSILQHAWAEIEHDLGYKVETIPSHLRRRFSMLAGVLELADREFISLRNDVTDYEQQSKEKASTDPDTLALDQSTLEAVLRNDPLFIELDKEIAKVRQIQLGDDVDTPALIRRLEDLEALGISDMRQLRLLTRQRNRHVLVFAEKFQETLRPARTGGRLPRGISLQYLMLTIKAEHLEIGDEDPLPGIGIRRLDRLAEIWAHVKDELGPLPLVEDEG